jgi:hypothetical protein
MRNLDVLKASPSEAGNVVKSYAFIRDRRY